MPEPEAPSERSQKSLDASNFLLVDVSPYLAMFLKGSQHWSARNIGLVMAVNSVASALFQIPAGLLVDRSQRKRTLLALAGLLGALACLLFLALSSFGAIALGQVLLAASSALSGPVLGALSLGIVGRKLLGKRVSRSGVYNHAGNLLTAVLAGILGQRLGYRFIFRLGCAYAVGSVLSAGLLPAAEVDHERARGGKQSVDASAVLKHGQVLVFMASVVLFHFGNAAMLPLAAQVLSQTHSQVDRAALSGCVISSQLAMMVVAWAVGRSLERGTSSRRLFLIGMLAVPLRGVLLAGTSNPIAIVAIQVLDGVSNGIFGVVTVVIVERLMRGTGRFNLAQGLSALCVGVGDALGNSGAGFTAQRFGYPAGFLLLGSVAGAGALLFGSLAASEEESSLTAPG